MTLFIDPQQQGYDVVIIGGGIMGASVAWWTAANPDFQGRILVVERDPSYEFAASSLSNSCIRQQFSSAINVKISQFTAQFIRDFRQNIQQQDAPDILLNSHGYLYLAPDQDAADRLKKNCEFQNSLGAQTELLGTAALAKRFPDINLDGIKFGSHNPVDEGYFDGATVFDWFRKAGRRLGVEYIANEVVDLIVENGSVSQMRLGTGTDISATIFVNAAGTRANQIATMADLSIPVEARRRFSFVFDIADTLLGDLPLVIDPSGVHARRDGRYFLAGCGPDNDPAVDADDFRMDHEIWEDKIWPTIAHRIPAFERTKVINSWVGHYDFNTMDQNAILGAHPDVRNLLFANGFSGHGLQQAPAVGRGLSELIVHGEYRTLDLTPLGIDRIANNAPLIEKAVI